MTDGPVQQTSGAVQAQGVVWNGVAARSVAIQETISACLTSPIVFCNGDQATASSNGAVTVAVVEGATARCVWFTTQN